MYAVRVLEHTGGSHLGGYTMMYEEITYQFIKN